MATRGRYLGRYLLWKKKKDERGESLFMPCLTTLERGFEQTNASREGKVVSKEQHTRTTRCNN